MVARDPKAENEPLVAEHSVVVDRTAAVGTTAPGVGREKGIEPLGRTDRGSSPRRIASLRVGALGVSSWLVSVAVPVAEGGVHSPADVVLVVLPLVALLLGVRFFASARPEATPLLGIAFPALVATAMAGRADPALSERYGAPLLVLSGVAMLAYAVAAAHALARPEALRETRVSKLAASPDAGRHARALGALVLGTASLAALVLTIVVPALGSRAEWAEAWGEAAEEGRVLVAILAAAVTAFGLTVVLGPALRASRASEVRPGGDHVTVAASVVVAVTFAMAWAMLRVVDP